MLRIVFVLGALSDAQDTIDSAGHSISLIAFWRGGQSVSDLKKALEKYSEVNFALLIWRTNCARGDLTYDDGRPTYPSYMTTIEPL